MFVLLVASQPRVATRLGLALPHGSELCCKKTTTEARGAVRRRECDLILLDVCTSSREDLLDLARSRDFANLPLVLIASVSVRSLQSVALLANHRTIQGVLISGVDDFKTELARHTRVVAQKTINALLVEILETSMSRLPSKLAARIRLGLEHGLDAFSVDQLSQEAGVCRRTADRWCAKAGMKSASHLVRALRVASAANLLVSTRWPLSRIALQLQMAGSKTIQRDVSRVTGWPPSRVRGSSTHEIALRIAAYLQCAEGGLRSAETLRPLLAERWASNKTSTDRPEDERKPDDQTLSQAQPYSEEDPWFIGRCHTEMGR